MHVTHEDMEPRLIATVMVEMHVYVTYQPHGEQIAFHVRSISVRHQTKNLVFMRLAAQPSPSGMQQSVARQMLECSSAVVSLKVNRQVLNIQTPLNSFSMTILTFRIVDIKQTIQQIYVSQLP